MFKTFTSAALIGAAAAQMIVIEEIMTLKNNVAKD